MTLAGSRRAGCLSLALFGNGPAKAAARSSPRRPSAPTAAEDAGARARPPGVGMLRPMPSISALVHFLSRPDYTKLRFSALTTVVPAAEKSARSMAWRNSVTTYVSTTRFYRRGPFYRHNLIPCCATRDIALGGCGAFGQNWAGNGHPARIGPGICPNAEVVGNNPETLGNILSGAQKCPGSRRYYRDISTV